MKVFSQNFKHLDVIPNKHTKNGGNISPSLDLQNIPDISPLLYIEMINLNTSKTHWGLLTDKIKNIPENYKNGKFIVNDFGQMNYYGPNDYNDIVTYKIIVYALRNYYEDISMTIKQDNVIDSCYIKFIYNGY
jgi:phosphatidylethanolamine-binding protein (PEBP) family uncharacterized protein